MLETYYKYRMEYKDFLLFIKRGNFYEVFDKDSLILNKLFGYKIKRIKDSIKVGFPLNRLDYILKLIGNINYVVIDNTVVEKQEFDNNKYKDYNFDINSIILNSIKIDRIYEELSSRLLDNNTENIITNIDLIIGKNI
jgi:DNA mismatch repair ATPase MutS